MVTYTPLVSGDTGYIAYPLHLAPNANDVPVAAGKLKFVESGTDQTAAAGQSLKFHVSVNGT
jgi:hypothetical protein